MLLASEINLPLINKPWALCLRCIRPTQLCASKMLPKGPVPLSANPLGNKNLVTNKPRDSIDPAASLLFSGNSDTASSISVAVEISKVIEISSFRFHFFPSGNLTKG